MDNGSNTERTNSAIDEEAVTLAKDLIDYKLGQNIPPVNATAKTLRRLSDDIERRNPDLLERLCIMLNFSKETGYSSFSEVATHVFSDGLINWGRIAVLYAFGAKLAKYCNENNMSEQLDNIPVWISRFVTGQAVAGLGDWIERQGGWSNLTIRFQDYADNASSWWKGALITTAFGIGSVALFTVCK